MSAVRESVNAIQRKATKVTVELQIGLKEKKKKNYDPPPDKRFSSTIQLPHIPRDGLYAGEMSSAVIKPSVWNSNRWMKKAQQDKSTKLSLPLKPISSRLLGPGRTRSVPVSDNDALTDKTRATIVMFIAFMA
ncbi:hypothetical protein G6F43_003784 [Rhizopus delemar]|nr:hypothetical protein G6F43_003784 [Rhizopus delemar]